ncbi:MULTISPECIES: ketopantoate reductase family protein [Clostridium]|uniref:ketopantoate reductase family protein n=1 Tax=Clostridium TaxID=1485 RepID=UPI0003F531E6|nr:MULTISPECIES: 2-dehydropantoate 2-reductase N-terminal domain-containing protein [Clostridium]MBN7573445.1 ketopantoate reductase family protein [Clostridium beijerinckii]MBN7578782.1 ketopantoate reductase family protein [Clostridium beijerinckii]MBN7583218.1 ketopantoate reductase family protein [Clostridium beijerinckii]MBO0519372.1 ketopantoate reductase family protein [Clostridium beijerinckii]MZK49102.1 ketopantoate reductase family protein [Clostridium beijerinckii]
MKILVYGAGVLGSYLAHVLIRGGNDVTLLARNERFKELKNNGLVIRHYIQCKTTTDKVKVIDFLPSNEVYEIIFVVMQYTHLNSILPCLSNNQSSNIIFVGNNADPHAIKNYMLKNSCNEKNIAFGFQSTGGRRENGKVICVRIIGQMELGGLDGNLSWKNIIDRAFKNTKYKLTYFDDMDSWLKSHIALIMPLCYASYACDGDLHKVAKSKKLLNQIIKAIDEGYKVLESLGYSILPRNEENFVRKKSYMFYLLLKITMITPMGRLAISDHAMSAVNEMFMLSDAFNILKQKSNISTPNWDELQSHLEKNRNKETCIN